MGAGQRARSVAMQGTSQWLAWGQAAQAPTYAIKRAAGGWPLAARRALLTLRLGLASSAPYTSSAGGCWRHDMLPCMTARRCPGPPCLQPDQRHPGRGQGDRPRHVRRLHQRHVRLLLLRGPREQLRGCQGLGCVLCMLHRVVPSRLVGCMLAARLFWRQVQPARPAEACTGT